MKGNKWLCLVLGLCLKPSPGVSEKVDLKIIYEWSQLEFDYESDAERQHDIDTGIFITGKPAPIDVDVYYNGSIFVTVPRFQEGVPVTLGTVTNKTKDGNPVIKPYPSWAWNRNPQECAGIVSVYRLTIDECGRLWVLDTGRLVNSQICPPKIMAFDLNTDELIHKYEIPSSHLTPGSILVTSVVDVRNHDCKDTFVYLADCQGFSIIVYDMRRGTSWKVQDKSMYPYPNYGTYRIAGEQFELMDGVLGMSISPYKEGEDRKLFYHSMSSPTENWVYTSHLRNETLFAEGPFTTPQLFHTYPKERDTQVAAETIDKNGVMFFGLHSEIQIACWNTRSEYGQKNFDVVASNPVTLQFASGIKIIKNKSGAQEMWVLTSRFQKVATGTINSHEPNFRIQAAKVADLLYGSKCKERKQNHI